MQYGIWLPKAKVGTSNVRGATLPQFRLNVEGLELFAGLHREGRARAGICDHADDARTPCSWPPSWACQRSVSQRHPVSGPLWGA